MSTAKSGYETGITFDSFDVVSFKRILDNSDLNNSNRTSRLDTSATNFFHNSGVPIQIFVFVSSHRLYI